MLIEIKVKIELSIIRLDILLERLKQALDVVHSVFKFTNELLFLCHRIDILTELFTKDFSFRCVVNQEVCVPVA